MTSVIMGNAWSPEHTAAIEPETPPPMRRYRLSMDVSVQMLNPHMRLRRTHIAEARARIRETDTWYDYLESTFRDVFNLDMDHTPPIEDVQVRLFVRRNFPVPGNYVCIVEWRGPVCDLDALNDAIDWRIGDRMCMYEICDEEEGWHAFIRPTKLSCPGGVATA